MPPPPDPLWAAGLAEQPRPAAEEYFPERPAQAPVPQPAARPRVRAAVVGAAIGLALAAAVVGRSHGSYLREDVPSAWGDIPMTCDTTRVADGVHAIERFTCRALGSAMLPPGTYATPQDRWTSDITRRDALGDEIVIAPDGRLTGVAVY